MDWLTFIVEMAKAVVWPGVTIFVLLFFRKRWTPLFDSLSELELFGQKAKFGRKMERVAIEAEQLGAEEHIPQSHGASALPGTSHTPDLPPEPEIINLLHLTASPISAFPLARSYLESVLIEQFIKVTGIAPGLLLPMDAVIERLEKERYITARIRRTVKELLDLGNKALHGNFEPSVENARDYVNSVRTITELIKYRSSRRP
ncbi:MAG: hypothetical protein Q7T87_20965 [Polaromonas sp.]|nr:hypothetical protein [Polaromonas sp.]